MTIVLAKQRDFSRKKKLCFVATPHLEKIVVDLKTQASEEGKEKILDFYA